MPPYLVRFPMESRSNRGVPAEQQWLHLRDAVPHCGFLSLPDNESCHSRHDARALAIVASSPQEPNAVG